MNRRLGVAACQMRVSKKNIQANLDTLAEHIKVIKYYSPWVSLVCAPELAIPGLTPMERAAQEIPGPITRYCSDLAKAHGVYLVPGSIYEISAGKIYNTAPVFDPQGGLVATYRKMYPWRPYEKVVSGGRTVTFDVQNVGTVGLCICYDLWFPEVIRDLVWKGAELILVPTLTGTQDRYQEILLCRAAAVANQCFIVSVNGLQAGGKGKSVMVDPEGQIIQRADQLPENLIAMLDMERVAHVRKYGTCGVSRVLGSFFHERHRFTYQKEACGRSPLEKSIAGFSEQSS